FNAKDDCCFESGYALPPLLTAAEPCFQLFGKAKNLRSHVNSDPGTHNYLRENREAFYKMVGDSFYPGDKTFSATQIECAKGLRTRDDLLVPLPADNVSINGLALGLAKNLPHEADWPDDGTKAADWQDRRRRQLVAVTKFAPQKVREAIETGRSEAGGVQ